LRPASAVPDHCRRRESRLAAACGHPVLSLSFRSPVRPRAALACLLTEALRIHDARLDGSVHLRRTQVHAVTVAALDRRLRPSRPNLGR
jgi:hypothetical protein